VSIITCYFNILLYETISNFLLNGNTNYRVSRKIVCIQISSLPLIVALRPCLKSHLLSDLYAYYNPYRPPVIVSGQVIQDPQSLTALLTAGAYNVIKTFRLQCSVRSRSWHLSGTVHQLLPQKIQYLYCPTGLELRRHK
jgi:hypothetical protein